MNDELWRARLIEALEQSGKSKRAVSLASGNGAGYVHSILTEGKDPTIDKLLAVCDAIPVSPVFIIHGVQVRPQDEEILRALHGSPEKRAGILAILGSE